MQKLLLGWAVVYLRCRLHHRMAWPQEHAELLTLLDTSEAGGAEGCQKTGSSQSCPSTQGRVQDEVLSFDRREDAQSGVFPNGVRQSLLEFQRRRVARPVLAAGLSVSLAAVLFLWAPGFHAVPPGSATSTEAAAELERKWGEEDMVCEDTPGWNNGWAQCGLREEGKDPTLCAPVAGGAWPSVQGYTCKFYAQKLCVNGQYKTFAMGPALKSPEKNCCACKGFKVQDKCNQDTGGECHVLPCNKWRGPSKCIDGKCMCQDQYCANSAGTCTMSARAVYVRQQVAAAPGRQAVAMAMPTCSRVTPGRCFIGKCDAWRGATECTSFQCHCAPGYCVDNLGGCYKDLGMITAAVVQVNQARPAFPGEPIRTALCVSGGGPRSLSAAMGVFRAMRDLGLISKADAISSVSGGSWASAILMFADMDLGQLLGPATNAQQLSLPVLDAEPAPLGAVAMSRANDIAMRLKADGVPLGMLWVATVAEAFMKPFGLDRMDAFMAPSLEAVSKIREQNPKFEGVEFQVLQPRSAGRAGTLIMGSTLCAPDQYRVDWTNAVSLQVAPDFTGSPFYPNNRKLNYSSASRSSPPLEDILVGGGLVSTYAFGGSAPMKPQGQMGGSAVQVFSPSRPLSVARAAGWSSAAFGGRMSSIPGLGSQINPQVPVWPVSSVAHPRPQKEMTYQLGDGGNLENTGLLAMLQRGAAKVISVINGNTLLDVSVDYCNVGPEYQPTGTEITANLANFFGYALTAKDEGEAKREFHAYNQVFASQHYAPLLCELRKLKVAGKALVVRKTLPVMSNAWWGIRAYNVDLVFMLLDKATEFEASLPMDTQQALGVGLAGGLDGFPGMHTCFQNPPDLTMYTARQINLLAAQTEWAVHQNADTFRDIFS